MPHVTDGLWNTIFSKLKQARILVMGTTDRMSTKIHVDHLVDAMSKNCPYLERLEFRFVLTLKKFQIRCCMTDRVLVSVGAVGAAATTDCQKD